MAVRSRMAVKVAGGIAACQRRLPMVSPIVSSKPESLTCGSLPPADAASHSRPAHGARVLREVMCPRNRGEGAGKAGWPLHPGLSRRKKLRKRETTGTGGDHTGLPCAMVYGLYVISSVNLADCHRRRRDAQASSAT